MNEAESLARRLRALAAVTEAAAGRADPEVLAAAQQVVTRAGQRVAFSGGYSVIALAGATGSGKSSLFNAITGTDLARVTVRRPTTSKALAVSWGTELPHELLDWLDITTRKLLPSGPSEFTDLVLLDLPDHDSTEVSHRLAVDHLVELVDALIWVVDPQKYADAALHEGYLRRLAPHAGVMLVVLNQSDWLSPAQLEECLADLRRLLDSEGLRATPIMATSAVHHTGIQELREAMARTVAGKQAMVRRLSADVTVCAEALQADLGQGRVPELGSAERRRVERSLADAAGVPLVVDGVRRAWRRRGGLATGWPFTAWIARFRPDPLKRLHLDRAEEALGRTSLPKGSALQQARAEQGLRDLTEAVTSGLGPGWVAAIRKAAKPGRRLFDRMDEAIAGVKLETRRGTWWWGWFTGLQWVLLVAALVGLGWAVGGPFLIGLGLPIPEVRWAGMPLASWLLLLGLGGGLLLTLVGRGLVALGASGQARSAERQLSAAVGAVIATDIIDPVQAELDRLAAARREVQTALKG